MLHKLDKKFITLMKERLLKEKDEIIAELASFADKGTDDNDYNSRHEDIGSQDEDNATEVADYNDRKAMEDGLEENLAKIDQALQRITAGTYGICQKCGKAIPKNRLEAFPAAENCVDC
jgi:RNA polymerase-binding protein DksA